MAADKTSIRPGKHLAPNARVSGINRLPKHDPIG
jgi:hypothetical protein